MYYKNAEIEVLAHLTGKFVLPKTKAGKNHKRHDLAIDSLKRQGIIAKDDQNILYVVMELVAKIAVGNWLLHKKKITPNE